jgi:hypothetical protein
MPNCCGLARKPRNSEQHQGVDSPYPVPIILPQAAGNQTQEEIESMLLDSTIKKKKAISIHQDI